MTLNTTSKDQIGEMMKSSRCFKIGEMIKQAMWCLGVVLIVGVSLVVLSKGRVPSIMGTPKLGIILWDLMYHGHFYKWLKCFLVLLNSWVDICKDMFSRWTMGVENIGIANIVFLEPSFVCWPS